MTSLLGRIVWGEGADRQGHHLLQRRARGVPARLIGAHPGLDRGDPRELAELHLALEVEQQQGAPPPKGHVGRLVDAAQRRILDARRAHPGSERGQERRHHLRRAHDALLDQRLERRLEAAARLLDQARRQRDAWVKFYRDRLGLGQRCEERLQRRCAFVLRQRRQPLGEHAGQSHVRGTRRVFGLPSAQRGQALAARCAASGDHRRENLPDRAHVAAAQRARITQMALQVALKARQVLLGPRRLLREPVVAARSLQVGQQRLGPGTPALGLALQRPATGRTRLTVRASSQASASVFFERRRLALDRLQEEREQPVLERRPDDQRLVHHRDARLGTLGAERTRDLAGGGQRDGRARSERPIVGHRIEAQPIEERRDRLEQGAGPVALAVQDEPGRREQRRFLGHLHPKAPVGEACRELGPALVAEEEEVQPGARLRARQRRHRVEPRRLVSAQRPGSRQHPGREAAVRDVERHPRGCVGHRRARADLQTAVGETGEDAHPLVDPMRSAGAAAAQRLEELLEAVAGVDARGGVVVRHDRPRKAWRQDSNLRLAGLEPAALP